MAYVIRRRAMSFGKKEDLPPEQAIGYNLLADVTHFKMQDITYGSSSARWPGTDEFIPLNPAYTYEVGGYNTRYYVHWFDSAKSFISTTKTGFYGGTLSKPATARYAQVVFGLTDSSIEYFVNSSYFRRKS